MKVRYSLLWVCLAAARFAAPDLTWAQANIRPNEQRLDANACLAELKSQPNIWVMEVYLKPLRMITVNVTDPKSGQVHKETFHYLVYRTTNRFISRDADANAPKNELDPLALPDMFVPEFELVTIDDPDPTQETESFPDEVCGNVPLKLWKVGPKGTVVKLKDIVLPEVVSEINQRERFQNAPLQLKNSVEISQPVPAAANVILPKNGS